MATPPQHRNNLRELLKQEQEPFHVQFSCNRGRHHQNPKQNASFPSTFSRNACFCSSTSSPDPFKNSPLLSPAPNSNKTPSDALFLHVPPKTAALLLQAALRVHNNPKSKTRIRNSGFGILSSLIKRIRIRNRTRIPKTGDDGVVRWAASATTGGLSSSSSSTSSSFSTTTTCTGNTSREEGKEEEVRFLKGFERGYATNNGGIGYGDFRSPRRRSPAFSSPARPDLQENVNHEQKPPVKSLGEDKVQNSPVSVLDPPFEDNESCEDREEEGEFQRKDGEFNLECSYVFLQRAKRGVLLKLQSLEPTKLEDRLVAEDDFLVAVSCESSLIKELESPGMKRLISDMIGEEEEGRLNCRPSSGDLKDNQLVVKRVCKRLESWRQVEANTIDMMIDKDFREESDKWKKQADDDHISRAATEVEFSIFSGLIEELLDELVSNLD